MELSRLAKGPKLPITQLGASLGTGQASMQAKLSTQNLARLKLCMSGLEITLTLIAQESL